MNFAEPVTQPLSLDRRARSNALCATADAAIRKGDLKLAQQLLIQANVDDPRNPYPDERLKWLALEIDRFEALKSSAKPNGRRFDFLYAPTLRGLSTELSSLLPLHPDVFSVPKHELDRAIDGRNELGLLAKYQHQVLNQNKDLRAGLVQHAFIAGQLAEPEVAERLANVTTRELFIHGVRDPVRLVISDFNHELIARYCGSYFFWPVYPKSPFCWAIYTLAGRPKYQRLRTLRTRAAHWRGRAAYYRQGLATPRDPGLVAEWLFMSGISKFSLDQAQIHALLNESLSRPRHFAVGQTYAQHFGAWVPVDLEKPASGRELVLSRVLDAIGVDKKFDHPSFHVSENTQIHRLMTQNWITVEICGNFLNLGLGIACRSMFSNTYPFSELLPFDPDERFTAIGAGHHPLCVTVERDRWQTLPRDVRIRLIESDELTKFRDLILIPAWLDSYAHWKSVIGRFLLRELDSAVIAQLQARIGADYESFIKRHTQFEHRWTFASAFLGR